MSQIKMSGYKRSSYGVQLAFNYRGGIRLNYVEGFYKAALLTHTFDNTFDTFQDYNYGGWTNEISEYYKRLPTKIHEYKASRVLSGVIRRYTT